METTMEMACVWCRQKLVVRCYGKRVVSCPSCKSCFTLPPSDQEVSTQAQQTGGGGVCERMKSLGSQLKTRIQLSPVSFQGHNKTFPAPAGSLNTPARPNAPRSTKRALLIGVTYKAWKYKLKGTVGDVQRMKDFLISKYSFPPEYVRVLTEDEADARFVPTKENIEKWVRWLVDGCRAGDSLVFYYSGHGLRQPDFNDDESDGFDETICPSDFLKSGLILDNDLNTLLVSPLIPGVKLHAIVDACHSGTILDLPFRYLTVQKKWKECRPPSGVSKNTSGGLAISISACEDNQSAADTTAFTGKMAGALTYILIDVLSSYPGPTYGDLLDLMEERIAQVNKGCLANARLLGRLLGGKLSQNPVISSAQEFDVYKTHFNL